MLEGTNYSEVSRVSYSNLKIKAHVLQLRMTHSRNEEVNTTDTGEEISSLNSKAVKGVNNEINPQATTVTSEEVTRQRRIVIE